MNKLTIYLANLSHVRDGHAATEVIPLNIGYLAAYLQKNLPDSLDVKLFNLPSELEAAMEEKAPHFLLCSNYVWNFNLNYFYLSYFKAKHPDIITVMGGANYPGKEKLQEAFLSKYDKIDFYVYMEGEITLLNLIKTAIDAELNIKNTKKSNLSGCHYLSNGKFINGGQGERVKNLDDIPSPYLSGLFDKMLQDGFVPMIETNRGCPFTCAYCFSSNKYYSKIYKLSQERIVDEIQYIGKRVKAKSLQIADSNFGILEQDIQISKTLIECKQQHGWPIKINLSTSKINRDYVFKCLSQLGDVALFSASMQSMNEKTLSEIRRKNLSFDQYINIIDDLDKKGVNSFSELILGMPEETKDSHMFSIKSVLDANIHNVGTYTCMILPNTPLSEDEHFDQFDMDKRYRVLPRDFGIYMGSKILETEQVSVATKTLSLEEYINLRGFNFIVSSYHNMGIFNELMNYLKSLNIGIFELLTIVHAQIAGNKGVAGNVYRDFLSDAETELWSSEDDIFKYYSKSDNFQKLLDGELGVNLIQKYQAVVADNLKPFAELLRRTISANYPSASELVVNELIEFCLCVRGELFSGTDSILQKTFNYDLPKWIGTSMEKDIEEFKEPISLDFYLDSKQKNTLNTYLDFYGRSQDSKGKILTRINHASLYKKYQYIQCIPLEIL